MGGDNLAKSYYSRKKREKETKKKLKQEQKRQRKLDRNTPTSADNSDNSHGEVEPLQTEEDESGVAVSDGEK
jgi:hypothetical protein